MHKPFTASRILTSALSPLVLLLASGAVNSQNTIFSELAATVKAPEALAKLGPDLFGDQVNLYTGVLSFDQTDVILTGTGDIPIRLGRRLAVGKDYLGIGNRAFGLWDLDVPHLYGVFEKTKGWTNIAGTPTRCTNFSPPPTYLYQNTWHFESEDYWQGNYLHVPGTGDQLMLRRNAENGAYPTDGASYPVVTPAYWAFSCIPNLANNSGTGEGFLGVAPNGTRYRFDHMVSVPVPALSGGWSAVASVSEPPLDSGVQSAPPVIASRSDRVKGTPFAPRVNAAAGGSMARSEYRLMPTLITDRFGNTVRFTYDPARPGNLLKVQASDGRSLTLTYAHPTAPYLITSATDGTRTWTYSYSGTALALDTVTQPDNTTWRLAGVLPLMKNIQYLGAASCDLPSTYSSTTTTGTMVHPSGATGTFKLTPTTHGRSSVPIDCLMDANGGTEWSRYPAYLYNQSLTAKTISGPGLPEMSWTYNYGAANASWDDCTGNCPVIKTVTVKDPAQQQTRYTFGNVYQHSEGKLEVTEIGWNGTSALRAIRQEYQPFGNNAYPEILGTSALGNIGHAELAQRPAPLRKKTITQGGSDYIWEAIEFDEFARATSINRASPETSRPEQIRYQDITAPWILGNLDEIIVYGIPTVKNNYHEQTGSLLNVSRFGLAQEARTYHVDGNLATVADAAGQTTRYENYKFGIPRLTTYADNATTTAVVNSIGKLDSTTDEMGFSTTYKYDEMGRLARVIYPVNDTTAWSDLIISFEKVATPQYGMPANFWRKRVQRGTAEEIIVLDALWRPLLSIERDIAFADSASTILRRFNHDGEVVFQSYPQSGSIAVSSIRPGITTQIDALGRKINIAADSELGVLNTTHQYDLATAFGGNKMTINPRHHFAFYSYYSLDVPREDLVQLILERERTTVIKYDWLGAPASVGKLHDDVLIEKHYVYDEHRRLCKTVEPEGITVQGYDQAGNIAWQAHGQQALKDNYYCQSDLVPDLEKAKYIYDKRNRLIHTSFSDGTLPVSRQYFPDGQLKQTTTSGTVWNYTYNKRRLLDTETLAHGGKSYKMQHGYNVSGHETKLLYPDNSSIDFGTDALGRVRKVGTDVSTIRYHANGAVASFTYGNGIVHSMTQNLRGMPERVVDNGVIDDLYRYDENGNTTSIDDKLLGVATRTLEYTPHDQLQTATSPGIWGTASYTIDSLDNIRAVTIQKGMTARRSTFSYDDGRNRIASTQTTGSKESRAFVYDRLGNIVQIGTDKYKFDGMNRMLEAVGKAKYVYDGHGRRVAIIRPDGSQELSIYSQSGQLLYSVEQAANGTSTSTAHRYLNDSLVKSGLDFVHTDGLRSVVAKTRASAATVTRTRYEPYGLTAAGVVPSIGFGGHVNDGYTGLVYMQQRYYDPLTGRFLSIDPVVTDANTGDSFNRYAYANNSPYKYIDPDGRDPELPSFFTLSTIEAARRDTTLEQATQRGALTRSVTMPAIAIAASPSAIGVAGTGATATLAVAGEVAGGVAEAVGTRKAGLTALTLIGALGKTVVNGPKPASLPQQSVAAAMRTVKQIAKDSKVLKAEKTAPPPPPPPPPKINTQ